MRALRWAAAAVLTGILLISLAQPATAAIRVLDRERARGTQASLTAGGSVDEPRGLWIKVKARPHQRVDVLEWVVVCSHGSATRTRENSFAAMTPVKRRLKMGYRRPDACKIGAQVQLEDSGRLTVILLARVPG